MEYPPTATALTVAKNRHIPLIIALFFSVGFLVYGASLGNDFVHFDDDILVFNNPAVHELTPASVAWVFTHYDPELYIPLTFLSYQIDYLIGGSDPMIFHLDNLLLHVMNALLVVWLVLMLIGCRGSRTPATANCNCIAIAMGLLFLVHPLHTEAVAWVSARKDLLSALFFLVSLITYLYYISNTTRRYYIMSLVAFALGLLAKVSIVVLPLILLLIDWYNDRSLRGKSITEKIPFFIIAIIFGTIALFGKTQMLSDSPLFTSILVAGKSITFYIQKLFIPTQLSVVYPYHEIVTITSPHFYIPLLLLLLFLPLLFFSLKRTKKILFATLFFLFTLAPSFTNYAKDDTVFFASDRYAYLPSIGILLLIATLLIKLNSRYKKMTATIVTIVVITFGFLAHKQSLIWKNTGTLFTHTTQYYEYYMAYNKIGADLWNQGKYKEAMEKLNHSIELKPNARAYYNLGIVYMSLGQPKQAIETLEKSLELNPDHVDAHINIGFLYWNAANTPRAILHFERAVALDPTDIDALTNLATLYIKQGRKEEAQPLTEKILEIDPGNTDAQLLINNLR